MEVPKPSYTAELFQPAPNNRPGPVIGSGEGSSIVYTQASTFKLIVISALKLSSLIALIMMLTLRHQTNFARAIDLHKHRPRCFVIILRPICNIRFLLTRDAQHLAQWKFQRRPRQSSFSSQRSRILLLGVVKRSSSLCNQASTVKMMIAYFLTSLHLPVYASTTRMFVVCDKNRIALSCCQQSGL